MSVIAIPVELLPIELVAAGQALECFEREYEGTVCAVCQSEKWANSPFCRACSIRLQRANMMYPLRQTTVWHGREWPKWPANDLRWYWKRYDCARDYLICTRKEALST